MYKYLKQIKFCEYFFFIHKLQMSKIFVGAQFSEFAAFTVTFTQIPKCEITSAVEFTLLTIPNPDRVLWSIICGNKFQPTTKQIGCNPTNAKVKTGNLYKFQGLMFLCQFLWSHLSWGCLNCGFQNVTSREKYYTAISMIALSLVTTISCEVLNC